MKLNSISATDLRVHSRDIVERARFKGERFVIHNFGRPVAMIIGIDEYNTLVEAAAGSATPEQCSSERRGAAIDSPGLAV
ncbi:MAG: type II toxin-antitoxin system Phd/YefM family antitoxin [Chloroflexi bacterium]|nr:type II toxin-antitoxin system Phd/YefM family antitoxin [Chloroflexota bacterium]